MPTAPIDWRFPQPARSTICLDYHVSLKKNRRLHFDLSAAEQEAAAAYNFPVAGHFVLQLGYSKLNGSSGR
jgi:hypothetical protein